MPAFLSKSIPCFLCGASLRERSTKRRKPYFVCDPCGVQVFIRRKAGIDLLSKLEDALSLNKALLRPHRLFEVQRLLSELNGLREEIKKIESSLGVFFKDKNLLRVCKALQKREKAICDELESLTKRPSQAESPRRQL